MPNQQLIDYIKNKLQQGLGGEEIKKSLLANNWQEKEIEGAFHFIYDTSEQQRPEPVQNSPFLPGAVAIMKRAWDIYKKRLGTFLGVMIIPVVATMMIATIFAGGGILGAGIMPSNIASSGIWWAIILGSIFFILAFIIQAWCQTALIYAIRDSQENIGVKEAYRRGWHKIFSYWWVSFLAGFIIFGGFFLLIIPGVVFLIWFSLVGFILISENLKGMDVLLKSREYIKNKWWRVFWRFLFIGGVSVIIYLTLIFVFSILKIPFSEEIIRFISGIFLTPLITTYSFILYKDLKAIRGEFVFTPTNKKKIALIFVGIIGIIILLAILGIFFSFLF